MADDNTIALRITVADAERAVNTLRQVGAEGERALQRTTEAATRYGVSARAALGQVGLQLQDVIVQLQSGQRPLTVLIQQGTQIAGIFGPLGAIIGAVGAAVGIAASAFLGLSASAAEAKSVLDQTVAAFEASESAAKRYAGALSEATAEQRRLIQAAARLDLQRAQSEAAEAVAPLARVLRDRAATVSPEEQRRFQERARELGSVTQAERELFGAVRQRAAGAAAIADQIREAALAGDASRVMQLAEQHGLTGDAATLEGVLRLVEVAQRIQVLRAAEAADQKALERLGPPDKSAARRAEAEARAAARRAAAEERRRLAEISRFELSELVRRAELGEFDDARSLAARERAERIIAEDARRAAEAQRRAAEDVRRQAEADAERQARILAAPFEEAAAATQRAFADAFEQILADGEVKFGDLAENLGSALQRSVAQLPALLISQPLTAATQGMASQIAAAIQAGSLAQLGQAFASPLGMGAAGVVAGSMMGGTGGAIGGGAGGVLGALAGNWLAPGPVGTIAGGAIGALLGSVLGGMFGGSGGNNRAGARIDLATGLLLPGTDELSSENQRRANALISQLASVRGLLAAGGGITSGGELRVRIGDKSGAELITPTGRQRFEDVDELRRAALDALLSSTSGLSETFQRAIESTRGARPEVLQDALSFAAQFERLVDPSAEVVQSFRALQVELEQAAVKAERYGLSVEQVREAQARAAEEAERDLRDRLFGVRDQIRSVLGSVIDTLGSALTAIRTGSLTALAPADQLAEAQRAFERELAAARSGDLAAQQRLAAVGQAYLAEAREFGASGPAFQAVFREVNSALLEIQRSAQSQQDRLLALLPDAIRDAQTPVIETLERQTRELVAAWDALRREIARVGRAA